MERTAGPPTALVPIADGSEEIEAVVIIDVLRRAGVQVTVATVGEGSGRSVVASRGVCLTGDVRLEEVAAREFDAVVLPGGLPGAEQLRDSAGLTSLLRRQDEAGRIVAAICAAPVVVLHHHDLLHGRGATCFPGLRDRLPPASRRAGRVVHDGNLITSQGPGTAMEFALALVVALCGHGKRGEIAAQLLMP